LPNWLDEWTKEKNQEIIWEMEDQGDTNSVKEGLFGLFQIDLERHIEYQFLFLNRKECAFTRHDILSMPYWEWELTLGHLEEYLKKQKDQQEKEDGGGGNLKQNKMYQDASKNMKGGGNYKMPNMPKVPGFGSSSMPKM